MLIKKGSKDKSAVSKIKARLIQLGYKFDDTGKNEGVFGAKMEAAVKDFQKKNGLYVDGQVGVMTMAALAAKLEAPVKPKPVEKIEPKEIGQEPFWVGHLVSRLGWNEFSHDKQIAKDWWMAGLPQYKSVIGKRNAWCGLACEIALRSGGLKGPKGSAAAASWSNFGEECDYICGAFLPIKHAKGGRHICVFLYWVDFNKRLAACIGGNQGNAYKISTYNLSGNSKGHESVIGGPRWPKGYPKTGYVYKKRGKVSDGSKESTR